MEEESVKVIEEKKKKIQDQVTAVMDKMVFSLI